MNLQKIREINVKIKDSETKKYLKSIEHQIDSENKDVSLFPLLLSLVTYLATFNLLHLSEHLNVKKKR